MWAENNKRKESGECLIVLSPRVVCLFWGSSFARCPYGDVFLFRRYRDMCQLFKLVRQISQNRYGHHVPAKSCAGSWATFLSKKFSRLHGFFKKEVLKKRYFWVFLCLIPYFSKPGPNTGSMISCNLQEFHRLRFRPKKASFAKNRFMNTPPQLVQKFHILMKPYSHTVRYTWFHVWIKDIYSVKWI